ncbi:MAG TPA: glycine oxidase ThiO [Gammaproteobacteria bacterium]|nr:glycine oxidase ThiO [Gammaproteobacteria bacterium]
MTRKQDVIVVGAGVVGLLSALELTRAGFSVTLVERGLSGREASRAAAGILSTLFPWRSPKPLALLSRWSQSSYAMLADDVRRASGIDPEWTPSGLLCFDLEDRDVALAWAQSTGRAIDFLEAHEVRRQEPALAEHARPAIFLPGIAHIHISRFLRALREALLNEGVPIKEETAVTGLVEKGGRIEGIRTEAGELHAQHVVIAAGAWSAGLAEMLGIRLPVEPVRGQIIQFRGPPGLLGRVLCESEHYLLARRSGDIIVGSTREHVGFDRDITADAREELTKVAQDLLPVLKGAAPARQWSGIRPGSPEGVPFIGAHPAYGGLWFNTGHYANGITLAPGSARLLADLMSGRAPILDPLPYRPDR